MSEVIVLKDIYNNIYNIDNDLCIGSITSDFKLQKYSICIDNSIISNIHYSKITLFSKSQIHYYENLFNEKFKNCNLIKIDLNEIYIKQNQILVDDKIIIDIENLYGTEISYELMFI